MSTLQLESNYQMLPTSTLMAIVDSLSDAAEDADERDAFAEANKLRIHLEYIRKIIRQRNAEALKLSQESIQSLEISLHEALSSDERSRIICDVLREQEKSFWTKLADNPVFVKSVPGVLDSDSGWIPGRVTAGTKGQH